MLPNFLIIGAAKSGTTALFSYLKQHPQIYMCPAKEPKFFAHENRPPVWRGPGDEAYTTTTVTNIAQYMALFHDARGAKAAGEASTQYLYMPQARERIKYYIPKAKLIAILRNPVEVAYSAYLHKRREGHELLTDFAQALAEEERRIKEDWSPIWHYRQRGFYYQHLAAYYEAFNPAQIRVYIYDDFKKDPTALLRDIFAFLCVDESFVPDMTYRPNPSGVPRSRALHKFLTKKTHARELRKEGRGGGTSTRAVDILRRWNLRRPTLSPQVHRQLIEDYREDVFKLQELLQRDLSGWLVP